MTVVDLVPTKPQNKAMVEATHKLENIIHTLQSDAYLALKCRLVIEEEVVDVVYTSLTSTTPGLARCKDDSTFSSLYLRFVDCVTLQDVAERLCCYMAIHIVLNTK